MVAMVPAADRAASCWMVTPAGTDGGPTRASGCEDTHSDSPIALRARARTINVAGKSAKTGTNTCRRYTLVTGPARRGYGLTRHSREGARVQGIVEAV